MTHPLKFRRHVMNIREREGLTYEQTSSRFNVGIASLTRWNNNIKPKDYVRVKRKLDIEKLKEDVKNNPDDFQYERAKRFGVCPKAIWQALRKIGITYKKSPAPSKAGRRKTCGLSGQD